MYEVLALPLIVSIDLLLALLPPLLLAAVAAIFVAFPLSIRSDFDFVLLQLCNKWKSKKKRILHKLARVQMSILLDLVEKDNKIYTS